ncbi:MAG: hypothetical protein ACO3RX_01615 [Chthoniobacterales bacterium]
MTDTNTPKSLGWFDDGNGAVEWFTAHGLVYPVTPCCRATAKGGEYGIICRACYQPIDEFFGLCFDEDEYLSGEVAGFMGKRVEVLL